MKKEKNKIILTESEYEKLINSNPLTNLPGNKIIEKVIQEKFLNSKNYFLVYFDISDFKAYNDIYGFEKGDIVIKEIAGISKKLINKNEFLGHIGGDDFVALIKDENLDNFIKKLFKETKEKRKNFYSKIDFEKGYIITFNRDGFREKIKLIGLTAVSFKYSEKFRTVFDVSEYASIIKTKAKNIRKLKEDNFISIVDEKVSQFSIKNIIEGYFPLKTKRSLIEAIGELKDISYIDYFIELLKRKDLHYLIKKSILFALGLMGNRNIKNILKEYLKSENPHLRMRATEAIGNIGIIELSGEIKKRLNDENKYVQRASITAAAKLGTKNLIPLIEKKLQSKDIQIKNNSILALAQLGDIKVIPMLFEIIKESRSYIQIKTSIRSLGILGKEKELRELLNISTNLPTKLKIETLLSIREILSREKIENIDFEKIKKLFISKSWRVRRLVAEILGFFEEKPEAKIFLFSILKTEKTDLVKTRAILSLKKFKGKDVINTVKKHLNSDIPIIIENCIITLSNIGTKNELDTMRIFLKHENLKIRELSAQGIINIMKREYGKKRSEKERNEEVTE